MEDEIIELLLEGLGVEQIANRLNATQQEVKDQLSGILRKLNLHSLIELRFLALSLPGNTYQEEELPDSGDARPSRGQTLIHSIRCGRAHAGGLFSPLQPLFLRPRL